MLGSFYYTQKIIQYFNDVYIYYLLLLLIETWFVLATIVCCSNVRFFLIVLVVLRVSLFDIVHGTIIVVVVV